MNIYTKKIEDIAYDDVIDFCNENIRENVNLDYKEDFTESNKLAKTMSAFANTFGGIVIIGVKDKDGMPFLPVEGIKNERGLSERITRIIVDNIYPLIFPEIKVCENDDATKVFVIIRIHPSNMTPHAIRGNTRAYVRINDTKNPEDLATMEQLDWLRNKREKSENLKRDLLDLAMDRHKETIFDPSKKSVLYSPEVLKRRRPWGSGSFSSIPLYPYETLSNPDELFDIFDKITIRDYFSSGNFPKYPEKRRVISDGVVIKHIEKYYDEINEFGLFYHGEEFMQNIDLLESREKEHNEKSFDEIKENKFGFFGLYHLISKIDLSIEFAYKFYKEIGYWGYVDMNFVLSDTDDNFLYKGDEDFLFQRIKKSLDYNFKWNKVVLVQELFDNRTQLIKDFCRKLGWCYGVRSSENLEQPAEKYLEKNKRLILENN